MRWAVAITTCPREESTIKSTLESLDLAGWGQRYLFAEPESPIPEGERHVTHTTRLGAYRNFKRSLKCLLRVLPNADAYLLLQDDVQLSRGLRRWLETEPFLRAFLNDPTNGVASLYSCGRLMPKEPGWSRIENVDGTRTDGALALILSPRFAREFSANPPGKESLTRTDHWVGEFCKSASFSYWMHNPSLCQHVGRTSTISRGWERFPDTQFARHASSFVEDVRDLASKSHASLIQPESVKPAFVASLR